MTTIGKLTWNRCAIIIVAVMAVAGGLSRWKPFWFAPPALGQTHSFYALLTLLWIPLLIVCALLRPAGKRGRTVLLVTLIGLIVIVFFTLPGLVLSAMSQQPSCTSAITGGNQVESECVLGFLGDAYTVYTFEGAQGSPFAQLVGTQRCSDTGCG